MYSNIIFILITVKGKWWYLSNAFKQEFKYYRNEFLL